MPRKSMGATPVQSESENESLPVDLVFRRAALINSSRVSARRRRLGARRRQGTN